MDGVFKFVVVIDDVWWIFVEVLIFVLCVCVVGVFFFGIVDDVGCVIMFVVIFEWLGIDIGL